MGILVHGITNCDTVKRARAWLDERAVAYEFVDFRKSGAPAAVIGPWIAALGWEALVNRSGMTWRRLDEARRGAVRDAESAGALMQAQPSVIRRPVVRWADGSLTVGFDPRVFEERLRAAPR
ncbi:MAG TPA: arsenate reductase [Burkholderiaceae bacterium]|nr:arsenate reductase [Burkholderiaceae bacterium]